MPLTPNSLEARDIQSVLHPYTNLASFPESGPFLIDRGEGIYVFDGDGNSYIEGMAGLWCTALGFHEKELIQAATAQMEKLPYYHVFSGKGHESSVELAEKLKAMMPFNAGKVSFTCSGSEANDTQIKLLWYYNNVIGRPKKKKIISRIKAYHGVTVASASLTGLPHLHADWDLPIDGILHTDCPHHYRFAEPGETEEEFATRLADNLDAMIQREDPDTIAAFIAEPIMGAGGVLLPPATTRCAIPKEAAGMGMLRAIAYGTELNLAHPPRPTDPAIAWEPDWNVKIRVKSVATSMIGMEGMGDMEDMGGADDADAVPAEQDPAQADKKKKKFNPFDAVKDAVKKGLP